jgi:hypothetical protein
MPTGRSSAAAIRSSRRRPVSVPDSGREVIGSSLALVFL